MYEHEWDVTAVSMGEFEDHISGKTIVRPSTAVYFSQAALSFELNDGTIVGYTVRIITGCPTCGPDYESEYYIARKKEKLTPRIHKRRK